MKQKGIMTITEKGCYWRWFTKEELEKNEV